MTAPLIPTFAGTVPKRTQSPSEFADNADAWLSYQSPLAAKYNDLAVYSDNLAVTVDADATQAAQSSTSAQQSAAIASANANFKGLWDNLTGAANVPYSVLHEGSYWQLLTNLASVQSSEPSAGNTDWALLGSFEDDSTTVIPQTGGGALTALRINEIRDGNTGYTLPLANSVLVNQIITITLPDEFKTNEPVVTRAGSDTISYSGGTDTSLTFDSGSSVSITLTSDGVSDWGL